MSVLEEARITESAADQTPTMKDRPARHLLMICYLFSPAAGLAAPAVQRARKLTNALQGSSWKPVILTVRTADLEAYFDRDPGYRSEPVRDGFVVRTRRLRFVERFSAGLKRVFVRRNGPTPRGDSAQRASEAAAARPGVLRRLKDAAGGLLQIPDPHIGWLPSATAVGIKLVHQYRAECIYATGFPWTCMLVGALLKVLTRRPLVLDFRDPWVTNPYRAHLSPWRRRLETVFESFAVHRADVVIANTRTLEEEFRERYPGVRVTALYNSVAQDLLEAAQESAPPRIDTCGAVRLTHAGFLYGPRDPATLLQAMAMRGAHRAGDLELDLVGEINVPYSIDERIAALGLEGSVVVRGPVDHATCQRMLRESAALLVLQPGTKTQLPSKLFEYAAYGKPILALAEPGSETYTLAAREFGAIVADTRDPADIARALDALVDAVRAGGGLPVARTDALARYSEAVAGETFRRILEDAVTKRLTRAPLVSGHGAASGHG